MLEGGNRDGGGDVEDFLGEGGEVEGEEVEVEEVFAAGCCGEAVEGSGGLGVSPSGREEGDGGVDEQLRESPVIF